MKITVLAGAAAALILLGIAAVNAHHGWGSYDTRAVTIEGPITSSSFQNPHATIKVKASDKEWTVTLAPVSRMSTRGATADKIAVGNTVTAYGYPSKVQPDEMRAEWIAQSGNTYQLR